MQLKSGVFMDITKIELEFSYKKRKGNVRSIDQSERRDKVLILYINSSLPFVSYIFLQYIHIFLVGIVMIFGWSHTVNVLLRSLHQYAFQDNDRWNVYLCNIP